uniref:Uncharacterized protein n=1 Tax=Anguilla anguilla TaxID=7936 RepID=A0A0E9UNN1_ANGAN
MTAGKKEPSVLSEGLSVSKSRSDPHASSYTTKMHPHSTKRLKKVFFFPFSTVSGPHPEPTVI